MVEKILEQQALIGSRSLEDESSESAYDFFVVWTLYSERNDRVAHASKRRVGEARTGPLEPGKGSWKIGWFQSPAKRSKKLLYVP